MQLIKKIFDFYIYSNIHVAIAGFCITKITLIKFGIVGNYTPHFVALSIIITYNFIHYYENKTSRLIWFKNWFFKNQKKIQVLTLLAGLTLFYITLFTEFDPKALLVLIPFGFITLFYVIPLYKIGKIEVSFRNFPAIKIFSISVVWAGISVFFPLYEADYMIHIDVYLEFIQRFLFLIVITLPFDIRDLKTDSELLETLPQVLGVNAAKKMGLVFLVEFVLLELFKEDYSINGILVLIITALISGFFLWFSSPERNRYYTRFWVESIPIIWIGLIVLF